MLNLAFPLVKRFSRAAAMHLEAAELLLRECPEKSLSDRATEVIYLSGYVAECILKALLLSHWPLKRHEELIEKFKSEIKHDLEKLKKELRKKKVELPTDQKENFNWVRSVWSSEMRYSPQHRRRKDAERVVRGASGLFGWVTGG